jgi:TRAP-type C4-dicarboxylate transport system permease large subunit
MTPILIPLMTTINMDLVHFGIIICFNIVLGCITPPMAIGIFILVGITGCTFEEIVVKSVKFLIPLVIALLVITFFPWLTLFLPNLFMGG